MTLRVTDVRTSSPVLLSIVLLALPACAVRKPPELRPDWRGNQEIWWTDSELVKNALVDHFRLQERHPEIDNEHDAYWSTVSLVLVLDGRNDSTTLRTLADLTSYYWGESGGEIFHCVVLRKGSLMTPYLQQRLDDPSNNCRESLGEHSARCLREPEYRNNLRGLLSAIARDESCSIER